MGIKLYLILAVTYIFLMISDIKCVHVHIGHLYTLFGEMFIQIFAHFKVAFLYCWDLRVLCIFWILTPYQTYDLQISCLIPWISFSLCWECHFWCSLICLSFYFFLLPMLMASFQGTIAKSKIMNICPMFSS